MILTRKLRQKSPATAAVKYLCVLMMTHAMPVDGRCMADGSVDAERRVNDRRLRTKSVNVAETHLR